MEQHPVPRQITTFEFKLIGFLTIKQFIYIIVFIPIGFIVYSLFPIPILNILLGIIVGGFGFALALLPINDRPLDVWVKNLFKRLTSPTQYVFHKQNQPIYFFNNLYFVDDPHRVMTHIESQEKLAAYLASTQATVPTNTQKQKVHDLFHLPSALPKIMKSASQAQSQPALNTLPVQSITQSEPPKLEMPDVPSISHATILSPQLVTEVTQPKVIKKQSATAPTPAMVHGPKPPFFTGIVKNHKLIPIPGILIYVKDENGKTLRLLKTNPHGVFATFNVLPEGEYLFELKDPRNTYFFDTMKIHIANSNHQPIEFFSKELL